MDNIADSDRIDSFRDITQWTVLGPVLWSNIQGTQFQLYAVAVFCFTELAAFVLVAFQSIQKSSGAKGKNAITAKWILTAFNYFIILVLTAAFFPMLCIYFVLNFVIS